MSSSLFFNFLKRNNTSPQLSWEEHALELGISVQQAFQFHNTYADHPNKCLSIKQIPGIFFFPKGLDLEILKREHQTQLPSQLQLDASPLAWKGRYSVIEHIDLDTIQYELIIDIKDKANGFQFSFTPQKYSYNNEVEDGKMAMVALKCMQTVHPILFSCEDKFQTIELMNHSEIQAKWNDSIADLKAVFIDEFAAAYFQQFEDNLKIPNFFSQCIQNHFPFELFFKLPFSKQKNSIQLHTIHPYNSVKYDIAECQITEKYQYKSIQINGLKNDERSFEQIFFNLETAVPEERPFTAKFSYELDLNPETSWIQSLHFTHEISLENEKKSHSVIATRIGID